MQRCFYAYKSTKRSCKVYEFLCRKATEKHPINPPPSLCMCVELIIKFEKDLVTLPLVCLYVTTSHYKLLSLSDFSFNIRKMHLQNHLPIGMFTRLYVTNDSFNHKLFLIAKCKVFRILRMPKAFISTIFFAIHVVPKVIL